MPFRKKAPNLEELPTDEEWTVLEGENEGNPMIVRRNATAESWIGHPELPLRMGIAIPLNKPAPNGLPSKPELKQLDAGEDRLFEEIGSGAGGRVVLIVTTSGMREYVSYVRSEQDAARLLEAMVAAMPKHEVQHYIERDKKWDGFKSFL